MTSVFNSLDETWLQPRPHEHRAGSIHSMAQRRSMHREDSQMTLCGADRKAILAISDLFSLLARLGMRRCQ